VGTVLNSSVADVNRDKSLDLAVVNFTNRSLNVFRGDGTGNFTAQAPISLGSGANTVVALAGADVNRNGSTDFIVGGQSGSPVLLATNNLPDQPVLADQMITTGYDNAVLHITTPRDLEISRSFRTVAGSAYWRFNVNGNQFVDDRAFDYNLQYGTYRIVVTPNPGSPIGTTWGIGISIDGSQQATICKGYNWGWTQAAALENLPSSADSLVFYYPVEAVSPIQPPYGRPTANLKPIFDWSILAARSPVGTSYQFQLDRYYDFRSPRIDTSSLATPKLVAPVLLGADSVYYWRYRIYNGATYSAYSNPFAVYISPGACCLGYVGNVDCDPSDNIDISDLTALIDNLYISFTTLCCKEEANVDGSQDGSVDISDLTALIDYLYISFTPLKACQ
jgi:hypothetical protein